MRPSILPVSLLALLALLQLLVPRSLGQGFPGFPEGREFFVAQNGNNGDPGTLQKPWKTVSYALRRANLPGDKVFLRSGTYPLTGTLRFLHDGSEIGGPITLATYPLDLERAVLDGNNLPSNTSAMLDLSGRRFIDIKGLELRNMRKSTVPHTMVLVGGRADHLRFLGNVFHTLEPFNGYQGSGRVLAFLAGPSQTISEIEIADNELFECLTGKAPLVEFAGRVESVNFTENLLRDNETQAALLLRQPNKLQLFAGALIGTDAPRNFLFRSNSIQRHSDLLLGGAGILIAGGSDVLIQRNRLSDNWIGLQIGGPSSAADVRGILIESNFVERSVYQGIALGGAPGALAARVDDIGVINNTFFDNGRGLQSGPDAGSLVLGQASAVRLIGNLVVATSSGPAQNVAIARVSGSTNPGIQLITNLYWSLNAQPPIFEPLDGLLLPGLSLWQAVTGQDTGSLQADPLLSLPSAGDLTISGASPARDKALTLPGTFALTDFFGQPRPSGSFADIGAHEF
jgi:hypothetical protein